MIQPTAAAVLLPLVPVRSPVDSRLLYTPACLRAGILERTDGDRIAAALATASLDFAHPLLWPIPARPASPYISPSFLCASDFECPAREPHWPARPYRLAALTWSAAAP